MRCNRRFEEIFGYAPGRADRPVDALHVRHRGGLRGGRRSAATSRVWRGETQSTPSASHVRKDGTPHLVLALGARGAAGRPGAGLGLALRRHHAGARVRGARAARARRAGADPRQRLGRHRLRAPPRHPALQPLPGGHGRRRARRADRPEHRQPVRLAHRLGGGRRGAPTSTAPGGTYDGEALPPRATAPTFMCRARGRRTDTGEEQQEWIWSYEDVTAEREAEMRVQRALAEQDLILDNATVGIAFVRSRVDPALQPLPRGDGGRGAAASSSASTAACCSPRARLEGGRRGRRTSRRRAGRHPRGRAPFKRRDGSTFSAAARPAHRRRRHRAGMDLELRGRHRRARARDLRVQASRDALERAVAERTAELRGGEGARPAPRRPRRAHRAAQPQAAGGPPDAGARALATATASRPR